MKKKNYLIILIGFYLCILYGCNEEPEGKSLPNVILFENQSEKWLGSLNNFEKDPNIYKKKFWDYYKSLKNDDLRKKKALAIYGDVLMDSYSTDSLYSQTILKYISEYTSNTDSLWILLHFHATDQLYSSRKYDKLLHIAQKGLVYCKDPKYDNIKVGIINLIGLSYSDQSKPDSAIKYFIEAISLAEKNGYYRKLGSIYNNLAYSYDMLYASNESGKMYQKAAENFLKAKDTSNYFALLTTYAINQLSFTKDTLRTLRLFDSAFVQYNKMTNISPFDSSNANDILAYKYYYLGKYDLSKKYLDKSINYRLKAKVDDYLLTYNYIFDSEIYFKKYRKLKDPFKTIKWAEEMKNDKLYYDALELYSQLYENSKSIGDFAKANEYLLISNALNDSLSLNNQKGQLFELEKKYETQKKEHEIDLQKSELGKKNTYIGLLVSTLAGIILAGIAYYYWQRQIRLQQDKLNSMNFTKQLLQTTEEERKRIAGDLHDSISHELLNLKSIFSQDIGLINSKIDTIINDIRSISRNLHPVMFDKIGLVPNIDQLIERVQDQNDFLVKAEINYGGSLTSADELQIYRIIQEALTNVIKYAKAYAAKITINEDTKGVWIEIKDNGLGFNVKETLNSSKAFGLHNIIERSRAIGGLAQIESSAAGTVITIRIPKKL